MTFFSNQTGRTGASLGPLASGREPSNLVTTVDATTGTGSRTPLSLPIVTHSDHCPLPGTVIVTQPAYGLSDAVELLIIGCRDFSRARTVRLPVAGRVHPARIQHDCGVRAAAAATLSARRTRRDSHRTALARWLE